MNPVYRPPEDLQKSRLILFYIFILVILFLFTARLLQLTIVRGEELTEKSQQNFLRQQRLPSPRGIIYDRYGQPLAENLWSYALYFSRYRLPKAAVSKTIGQLAEVLSLDRVKLEEKLKNIKLPGESILIAKELSLAEITPIMEQEKSFAGITIEKTLRRHYPLGQSVAHITGYLGSIPPAGLAGFLARGYTKEDKIGISGIEKTYEGLLRGRDGYQLVVRNALGKVVNSTIYAPSEAGANLFLTIDSELQKFCWEKIKNREGVIIVTNPKNGEVLAMVSSPSFDPLMIAKSQSNLAPSFFNRAIQGRYFPGSTIKPILAIAGLENEIKPEKRSYCSGKFYLPDWRQPFLCSEGWGHGFVNLRRALEVSCNSYFYTLAQELGGKTLVDYASPFNLGQLTGIDLPFENEGFLPLYQYSELKRGLLVQFGIGQGRIQVTPIQLACAFSAIANNGWIAPPHLLLKAVNEKGEILNSSPGKGRQIKLKPETIKEVLMGLYDAVNKPGGTAFQAQFSAQWKVGGKTGSAENARGGTDAWFICFAPYDDPQILVLVLVENGGHGGQVAAPIARDILSFLQSKHPL